MRTIRLVLEDEEYARLERLRKTAERDTGAKKNERLSWKEFILGSVD